MIKFENVSKKFGKNTVLDNINFEINEGSIYGLVGINGAGKSTLLRMLSGIYETSSGLITIGGLNVFENKEVKSKIFFLPDDPYYSFNLTAEDLKNLYLSYYNLDEEVFYRHLKTFKLDPKASIHNYSKGMKRQVFMSLAMSLKPKYLLLDEAFDGLDPLARLYFKREIIKMTEEYNTTVIISSHALRELEDICDSYAIIDHSSIIASGDLNNALESVFKYQVAFKKEFSKDFIKSVDIIKYEMEGKISKFTFKGDEELFLEEIKKYEPFLIDKITVNFEELFTIEVEARGYLK